MDHRWGKRLVANLDVRYCAADGPIESGRLRDLSTSGGYLETVRALPVFSMIEVCVPQESAPDARARDLRAYIVRRDAEGVGFEWDELHSGTVAELMHSIERGHRASAALASTATGSEGRARVATNRS
jgi:hypothetical protein